MENTMKFEPHFLSGSIVRYKKKRKFKNGSYHAVVESKDIFTDRVYLKGGHWVHRDSIELVNPPKRYDQRII